MAFFMTYLVDEENGSIRASLPDFNLYTFASAVSEVPARLQEAIAAGYHGKEPKSSGVDDLKDDPRYQGGWWLWLNIDMDDLPARRHRRKTVSHQRPRGGPAVEVTPGAAPDQLEHFRLCASSWRSQNGDLLDSFCNGWFCLSKVPSGC